MLGDRFFGKSECVVENKRGVGREIERREWGKVMNESCRIGREEGEMATL